jgi:dTDP-4-dehydrorhamnose 3,5-epimerase
MKIIETEIEGVVIIEPKVFGDERGFFLETFNTANFQNAGLPTEWAQDNWSRSKKGVLRGLHFQEPNAQGKLVRVMSGGVFDVAVDIRKGSKTFGKHVALELSADNKRAFYVPPGLAHGFLVLSDVCDFTYKCTTLYAPQHEKGILWNDPDLAIKWPMSDVALSEKDKKLVRLKDYQF